MKTLDEDITDGIAYGFPACCILAFVNRGGTSNGQQAIEHGIVSNQGNPYIPCGFFHHPDFRAAEPWEVDPHEITWDPPFVLIQQRWDPVRGYTDGDT